MPDELEYILKDSGSTTLVFGAEFIDTMSDLHGRGDKTEVCNWIQVANTNAAGDVSDDFCKNVVRDYVSIRDAAVDDEPVVGACDDELLYIMYTSGTTGLPKGVVHSHNTSLWALFTFAASCDLRDADRYLVALPLFHVGSLVPLTLNVYRGVTSVVMREFDPVRAWELIQEEKIGNSLLVPAMLNFMIQLPDIAQYDYSSVRWIQSGASPLPVNLIQKYADIGVDIHQIYGLTESCGPACVISAENALTKIGSTGRAFFHTEARVVDGAGDDCAPGVQGEVWISGRHVMLEYWNRPEATAETITPEGWLRTGDVASVDAEGFIYIQDRILNINSRARDMILRSAENVYPAEIENVILSHPDVAEVAVIGQPSEKWGESPLAVVVRKHDSVTAEDILGHCDGKLGSFKLPKAVVFIDLIPRNANGKVLKRELRIQFPGPAAD